MPKGSVASTASGMLNDLKSRLGFSQDKDGIAGVDDFDEYDDLDDDGYSPRYDSEYAGFGADYDENAPVGGYRPARTRTGGFGRADSTPNLVSIDDVKANTPLSGDLAASRRVGSRNLIDERAPAQSSPAYNASLRDRAAGTRSEARATSFDGPVASSSDLRQGAASPMPRQTRGMAVIRPVTYSDAERVARSLRAGDAVVLAMRTTPDELMQRVLDFSFGVASALDASVECPAERVFAIARGQALTEDEKRSLRNQGVM